MAPHKLEELSIRDIAEELFKKPRFRSYITKERVTCLSIFREACRVTLQIPAALFVLDRSFRRPEERLLGKVDSDPKPFVVFRPARQREKADAAPGSAKEYLEVATRTESLRSTLRLPDEDQTVIELARFHEDLAAKHEVPERGHQRFRRLFEHLDDDDAIVGPDSSTLPWTVRKRTASPRQVLIAPNCRPSHIPA